MVKMCDLRVVQKDHILFLEKDECAIVVNGCMHLFTHKDNVDTPSLQAIYNAGDIIGNSDIDKGWSRDTHSWIIAYDQSDFIMLKKEYVNYLWDKMKQSSLVKPMAERLLKSDIFKNLSEQTIYTIVFDMLNFKTFKNG